MMKPDTDNSSSALLLWFLGAWFFLSVAMAYVAGSTFATMKPDRLRRADEVFSKLDATTERPRALKFVAAELNRRFFLHYGNAQLAIGLVALILATRTRRRLPLLMIALAFALAVFFRLHLIPEATTLGRAIDFLPRQPMTPERARFDNLHRLSTGSEVIKMVFLLGATLFVLGRKRTD